MIVWVTTVQCNVYVMCQVSEINIFLSNNKNVLKINRYYTFEYFDGFHKIYWNIFVYKKLKNNLWYFLFPLNSKDNILIQFSNIYLLIA